LWGHLKELVYATTPADVTDLVARISAAIDTIDVNMLRTVRENVLKRARACIQMGGRHFEHLL